MRQAVMKEWQGPTMSAVAGSPSSTLCGCVEYNATRFTGIRDIARERWMRSTRCIAYRDTGREPKMQSVPRYSKAAQDVPLPQLTGKSTWTSGAFFCACASSASSFSSSTAHKLGFSSSDRSETQVTPAPLPHSCAREQDKCPTRRGTMEHVNRALSSS
jgi:hypothetical protein